LFFIGTLYAFQGPASQSLLPNIVSKKMFPKATALLTSTFQFSTIIGPAVGGFLVHFGYNIAYICITLFALSSCFCIFNIRNVKQQKIKKHSNTFAELTAGLKYIKSKRAIFGAISLDMFVVLFGGATALLPIYASDILNAGSLGYGILRSSSAIGALIMSIYLSTHTLKNKVGIKMFICVIGFCLMTMLFAISKNFILSMFLLALLGVFDVVSMVIRSTFVQLNTPDDVRGRVSSVNLLFVGTSNQLGEFESGTLASIIGTEPAVFLGGVIALVITLLWMYIFADLRKIDNF
jgi:MFS family permease